MVHRCKGWIYTRGTPVPDTLSSYIISENEIVTEYVVSLSYFQTTYLHTCLLISEVRILLDIIICLIMVSYNTPLFIF